MVDHPADRAPTGPGGRLQARSGGSLPPDWILTLHADALWNRDAAGHLLHTNEQPDPTPAPRLYVGRAQGRYLVRTGAQISPAVRESLLRLSPAVAYADRETVVGLLAADAPCAEICSGPMFCAEALPPRDHPDARLLGEEDRALLDRYDPGCADAYLRCAPVAAAVVEGEIRALCFSSRITAAADEAGVETAQGWRGRGYGRQAVLAWAYAVQAEGKVVLYSTGWDNVASRALARSLGLRFCGEDLSFY